MSRYTFLWFHHFGYLSGNGSSLSNYELNLWLSSDMSKSLIILSHHLYSNNLVKLYFPKIMCWRDKVGLSKSNLRVLTIVSNFVLESRRSLFSFRLDLYYSSVFFYLPLEMIVDMEFNLYASNFSILLLSNVNLDSASSWFSLVFLSSLSVLYSVSSR